MKIIKVDCKIIKTGVFNTILYKEFQMLLDEFGLIKINSNSGEYPSTYWTFEISDNHLSMFMLKYPEFIISIK